MEKNFTEGDRVTIHMSENTMGWMTRNAILDYIPCATGDSFQFTLLKEEPWDKEEKLLLNPSCSIFIGITK